MLGPPAAPLLAGAFCARRMPPAWPAWLHFVGTLWFSSTFVAPVEEIWGATDTPLLADILIQLADLTQRHPQATLAAGLLLLASAITDLEERRATLLLAIPALIVIGGAVFGLFLLFWLWLPPGIA